MEKTYKDSTFLARWMEGRLSREELEAFEQSEDYSSFNRIKDLSQNLKAPVFKKQDSFNQLLKILPQTKTRSIKGITNFLYGAAAAILILFGVFFFMDSKSDFATGFGDKQIVDLPDTSQVYLNSNSSLSYNKKDWESNRELIFTGEAFFDVKKGSLFKVTSEEGIVEVLGTEFNVTSRVGYFEVICNEGKVKVSNLAKEELLILKAGEAFRLTNGKQDIWNFKSEKPTWLTGESSFVKAPLKQVIKSLENQYQVLFETSKIDLNLTFTGSFTHKDLALALKTVFKPLNIFYKTEGKTIILTKRK